MRTINALAAVSVIGVLALSACGGAGSSDTSMEKMDKEAMSTSSAMEKDSMEKDSMDKDAMDKDAMDKDSMSGAGRFISYEDYSSAMMSNEAHEGTTVLFFNASWCPDCQAMTKALEEDPSLLPAGVDLVDVDYDSHADLRKEYGVTMQHTFVQVDASGKAVTSWSSSSVEDLSTHLSALEG